MESVKEYWGMVCPACGKDDDLLVSVIQQVRLTEDGTEGLDGDQEWDDMSMIFCQNCCHRGVVLDFYATATVLTICPIMAAVKDVLKEGQSS